MSKLRKQALIRIVICVIMLAATIVFSFLLIAGKLRIRPSGSAGGHNGLKSIIARLGGENFPRIRIGVGAKPRPDYDLADWVLGKFPPEDAKAMADRYPDLEAAAKLIMDGKLGLAQSKYNG